MRIRTLTAISRKRAVSSARRTCVTQDLSWRKRVAVSGSTSSTWESTRRPSAWSDACNYIFDPRIRNEMISQLNRLS